MLVSLFDRKRAGNISETLRIAWPLMLAQVANALYDICDGYFLAKSSSAAMIASLPARMVVGTLSAFFICSIGYMSTFVAQFHGGGRERDAVASFAQGLWMSLFAAPVFLLLIPASWFVVDVANHAHAISEAEKAYLLVCAPGGVFTLLNVVLGGFITGQGRTRFVSACSIVGCLVNLAADSVLVLGKGPVPAMGITGAAIATVLGYAVTTAMLAGAVLRNPLFRRHACRETFAPDWRRMREIFRFGAPTGVTAFAASFAFMVFSLVLTGLDSMSANAANTLFRVNNVFYMALCATSDGTLILTGRHHGANDDDAATRSYYSGLWMVFFALSICFAAMLAFPEPIVDAFRGADADYEPAVYHGFAYTLICIMFFRELAEGAMCLTVGALRGVGDTKFVMWTQTACDLFLWMPFVLLVGKYRPSIMALWISMPVNMTLVALILHMRWRSGKWRALRLSSCQE